MTTDDRNGTRVSWRTDTMPHFDHGYSSTAHKMQGQTKDAVWHLSSKSESNEQALVAFTRIKTNEHGTYKLVGTAETIEALRAGAMGRLAPQRNALDLMREAEEAKAVADDLAKNGPRGVVLVGHGEAPYKNDATQRMSYFISVRDDRDRERTMWGADLRRAMNDSGAKIGERITIACAGDNQDVTVDGKAAIRNGWAVDRVPQVQPIKPEPVKSPAPTVEHGHDRERVRERVRELVPPPARAAGRSWTF